MPTGPDRAVRGRPATVTDSTQHARHRPRTGLPQGRWNTPGMDTIMKRSWTLRPAEPTDVEAMTELRALVMRPDLERLGRYDEHRVRQRLRAIFAPEHTSVVLADGEFAGCVTMRPVENGRWVENFYLSPALHGQGIGSAVLRTLLERADADRGGRPARCPAGQRGPSAVQTSRVHAGARGPDRCLSGAPLRRVAATRTVSAPIAV